MKQLLTILFTLCVCMAAWSQSIAYKGMDSNPRLNEAESAYLQQLFPRAIFSFHDKHVGFCYLSVDTVGIRPPNLWHVTKQRYFMEYENGQHVYAYRLYLLNGAERKKTNGYDAIVLFTEKKFEQKLSKITNKKVIQPYWLAYAEIPDDAGSDNNPVLSKANAGFIQALYGKAVPHGFDFYGKKIAVINTHENETGGPQIVSIGAYVARVRESLLLRETYYTDFIYLLNEEQKKQSGGYDIVIQYMVKKDIPLENLVRFLGTGAN